MKEKIERSAASAIKPNELTDWHLHCVVSHVVEAEFVLASRFQLVFFFTKLCTPELMQLMRDYPNGVLLAVVKSERSVGVFVCGPVGEQGQKRG